MQYPQPLSARTVGLYARSCALTTQALGRALDVERRRILRWTRNISSPPRLRETISQRHADMTQALSAIIDLIEGHKGPVLLRMTDEHPEVTFEGVTLPASTWKEATATLVTINQLGFLDRDHEIIAAAPPELGEDWVTLLPPGEPTFAVLDRTPDDPRLHLCRTRLPADGSDNAAPGLDAATVLETSTLPPVDGDRPAPYRIADEALETLGYRATESWTLSGRGIPIATAAILPDYSLPAWGSDEPFTPEDDDV